MACLPNPYKLSILDEIRGAIILPFSSSKYLFSCLGVSNLVDLSFQYLSFSNKRKTTILFTSPFTFSQRAIDRFHCCATKQEIETYSVDG